MRFFVLVIVLSLAACTENPNLVSPTFYLARGECQTLYTTCECASDMYSTNEVQENDITFRMFLDRLSEASPGSTEYKAHSANEYALAFGFNDRLETNIPKTDVCLPTDLDEYFKVGPPSEEFIQSALASRTETETEAVAQEAAIASVSPAVSADKIDATNADTLRQSIAVAIQKISEKERRDFSQALYLVLLAEQRFPVRPEQLYLDDYNSLYSNGYEFELGGDGGFANLVLTAGDKIDGKTIGEIVDEAQSLRSTYYKQQTMRLLNEKSAKLRTLGDMQMMLEANQLNGPQDRIEACQYAVGAYSDIIAEIDVVIEDLKRRIDEPSPPPENMMVYVPEVRYRSGRIESHCRID